MSHVRSTGSQTALGNQTYCYLLENGVAVKTSVQCGISDGPWVEVTKRKVGQSWQSLTGDEQIVLGDLAELTDGQRVQVARDESSTTGKQDAAAAAPES